MQLSDRLNAVLNLVVPCDCVADVGCDHGFIAIEMINRGIAKHVIAMDVRQGPLGRAQEHIKQWNLQNKIDTRLSDGVCNLNKGEAQSVVIAGMGGNLVIHILQGGMDKILEMGQCVLQPQSEIEKVRRFLRDSNLKIVAEDMILEDGKYYPMMRVEPFFEEKQFSGIYNLEGSQISDQCCDETTQKIYDCYGELLLKGKNPVLKKFLLRQLNINQGILDNLLNIVNEKNNCEEKRYIDRIEELNEEEVLINKALCYWD